MARFFAALLLGVVGSTASWAASIIPVDEVIRYVNGEAITQGELVQRVKAAEAILRSRGELLPDSGQSQMEMRQRMMMQALAEATAGLLLEQEADRLKLPVDTREIRRDIIGRELRGEGQSQSLKQITEEMALRTRQQKQRMCEMFYFARLPQMSPAQLAKAYGERSDRYQRPARARVWRIVMRTSDAALLEQTRQQMTALVFQGLARDNNAALQALVTEDLRKRFLKAEGESAKCKVLAEALEQALKNKPAEPPPLTKSLLDKIQETVDTWRGMKTSDEVQAQLKEIRAKLLTRAPGEPRLAAFKEAAKSLSVIGHEAKMGGDAGFREPGDLQGSYDKEIFALKAGDISPIFRAGNAYCLVMVSELREAQQQSLSEVSVRLRKELRREQEGRARKELIRQLWKKASIHDARKLDVQRLLNRLKDDEHHQVVGGQDES